MVRWLQLFAVRGNDYAVAQCAAKMQGYFVTSRTPADAAAPATSHCAPSALVKLPEVATIAPAISSHQQSSQQQPNYVNQNS